MGVGASLAAVVDAATRDFIGIELVADVVRQVDCGPLDGDCDSSTRHRPDRTGSPCGCSKPPVTADPASVTQDRDTGSPAEDVASAGRSSAQPSCFVHAVRRQRADEGGEDRERSHVAGI